jgi:hypothetical protein
MVRTVTVIFDGEVFRPVEPVDLPRNTVYSIHIEHDDGTIAPRRPLLKYLALAQDVDLPADFAAQVDHYLRGTPKR